MNFYRSPEGDSLQQGDILFPVPFAGLSAAADCVVVQSTEKKLRKFNNTQAEEGVAAVRFESGWGMLITQSCDLAQHAQELIAIARIYPITKRFEKFKDEMNYLNKEFVPRAKNPGKMPQYLFLPACSEMNLPKSVVYLLEIQSFPRKDYDHLRSLRRGTLTGDSRQSLQERLAFCFGRFAAPDHMYYSEEEWKLVPKK